ncbi:hypothetical protein [Alteraurantiacibacter palmitatis]|uniref:Flagellar hook-length control protein FliK n=1 Tax=Alteraurantiacibacter palmitatis TaxID=2054628 RepID=A0ABV7E8N5_9SPHN
MNLASLLSTAAALPSGSPAPQGVNAGGNGGEAASLEAFADLLAPLLQGAATPDPSGLSGNPFGRDPAESGKDLPVAAGIAVPDAAALAVLPDLPAPQDPAPPVPAPPVPAPPVPAPAALTAALAVPDAAPNADVPLAAERAAPSLPAAPQVASSKPAMAQEMPGAAAMPVPAAALARSVAPAITAAPLAMPFARSEIQVKLRGEPSHLSAAQSTGAPVTAAPVTTADGAAQLVPEQLLARASAVQAIAARLAERAAPSAATPLEGAAQESASPLPAVLAMPVRSAARGAAMAEVAGDKSTAAQANAPLPAAPASAPAPAPSLALADAPRMAAAENTGTPQAAATPATPGHDFEAVIDKLAQARELAQPGRASLQIAHREFGQVAVQFDMIGQSLKVALSSSDAGFAPAVQAALADRPVIVVQDGAAVRNDGRGDGRNDARADQGGGPNSGAGPSAHSDQQRGEQQARAARNLAAGEQILRQNEQNPASKAEPRAPRDGSRFA